MRCLKGKTLKRGTALDLDHGPKCKLKTRKSNLRTEREKDQRVIESREWESSFMILSKSWRTQVIRTVTFGEIFDRDRIVLGRIQIDWGLRLELAHLCNCNKRLFECEMSFCKCKEERRRKLAGGSVRSTRGHRIARISSPQMRCEEPGTPRFQYIGTWSTSHNPVLHGPSSI